MSDWSRTYATVGPDGYPPEWHAVIKHAVREDADHRCVRCGHPYRRGEHGNGHWSPCDDRCVHGGPYRYEWNGIWEDISAGPGEKPAGEIQRSIYPRVVEAAWRILTVHHLDGDKANCRWWNLAALCQRCHLTIQGRVQMARVWPWEHSEWFQPYAAGFYAWTYLREDITRVEAEARLDDLLALEAVRCPIQETTHRSTPRG